MPTGFAASPVAVAPQTAGAARVKKRFPDAPELEEAIGSLMDRFYARARRDDLLGPIFARAIQGDEAWAAHLARLRDFWSSMILRSGRYHGDPFSAHLRLPGLTPAMFTRWLALFAETCAEIFEPETADVFRERAERIARSLQMGLFERLPASPGRSRDSGVASGEGGQA